MDLLTNGATQETNSPTGESAAPEAASGQEKSSVQSHTVTPKKVTVVDQGSRFSRISLKSLRKTPESILQLSRCLPKRLLRRRKLLCQLQQLPYHLRLLCPQQFLRVLR